MFRACAEVSEVRYKRKVGIYMNTINYVIKVTKAQVFVASTKIRQTRLVEQLAVWRASLFKADFQCKPLHRLKRVDVLCKIKIPSRDSVFKMGSH